MPSNPRRKVLDMQGARKALRDSCLVTGRSALRGCSVGDYVVRFRDRLVGGFSTGAF
jgi:hypothetical protein